jgi:hypothetical protein
MDANHLMSTFGTIRVTCKPATSSPAFPSIHDVCLDANYPRTSHTHKIMVPDLASFLQSQSTW